MEEWDLLVQHKVCPELKFLNKISRTSELRINDESCFVLLIWSLCTWCHEWNDSFHAHRCGRNKTAILSLEEASLLCFPNEVMQANLLSDWLKTSLDNFQLDTSNEICFLNLLGWLDLLNDAFCESSFDRNRRMLWTNCFQFLLKNSPRKSIKVWQSCYHSIF